MLPNLGTDWLINNNLANSNAAAAAAAPAGGAVAAATAPANDYFPAGPWSSQPLSTRPGSANSGSSVPILGQAGPSNYYLSFYGGSIAPSLLAPAGSTSSASSHISSSVDVVDKIIASESPMAIESPIPMTFGLSGATTFSRGRTHSVDSEADADHEPDGLSQHSHSEHEHDHDEGVERDGMIWGMKVDEYRALSARERKRVRNRISARTFRAKRKEHLSSLESTLGAKDLEIKLAHEENARLRRELADMRRRLSKYETQKPY